MTLSELITEIVNAASSQPSVHMVVLHDIFRLNECPAAKYGVFSWTQGEHSTSADSGLMSYRFTFFYVDRLMQVEDSTQPYNLNNVIDVQSHAIQVLDNIIRLLPTWNEQIIVDSEYTFTTFTQRFEDNCAGAYVSVRFLVPTETLCGEGPGMNDILFY